MQKIDLDKFVKDKTLGYFYVYLPDHELANGFGYLMDEPFIAYGEVVEGSFCETALRKKHKPSDMSFEELMKSFNTLKEIA